MIKEQYLWWRKKLYENVKNDILSWYPKVKVGGWLAGHDYFLEHFGVKE